MGCVCLHVSLIYMRIFICTVKVAHIRGLGTEERREDPTQETTPLAVVSCLLPRQTNKCGGV